jgi:hypothetical protein
MSCVSLPVITKGCVNAPVTTQLPCGIGEVAKMGFGTVVAPAGACPDVTYGVPKSQIPNSLVTHHHSPIGFVC